MFDNLLGWPLPVGGYYDLWEGIRGASEDKILAAYKDHIDHICKMEKLIKETQLKDRIDDQFLPKDVP